MCLQSLHTPLSYKMLKMKRGKCKKKSKKFKKILRIRLYLLFFYFWNRPKRHILTFNPLFCMKKARD